MFTLRSRPMPFWRRIVEDFSTTRSEVLLVIGPSISARALSCRAIPRALGAADHLNSSFEALLPRRFGSRRCGRQWEMLGDSLVKRSCCCKTYHVPASDKLGALRGLAIVTGASGFVFGEDIAADYCGLGEGEVDDHESRTPGQMQYGDAGAPNYGKHSECSAVSFGEHALGENGDLLAKVCIAINLLIFSLWRLSMWLGEKSLVGVHLVLFLNNNFVLSYPALKRGRLFIILTAMFSHIKVNHFLVNMVLCWTFIPMVSDRVDLCELFALYFGGGIFSSAYGFVISRFHKKGSATHFVGASGALWALIMFYLLARERRETLFFLPLDYFETAFGLFIAGDAAGSIAHLLNGPRRVGWWTASSACDLHIGGVIFGALFYHLLYRRGEETSSKLDSDSVPDVEDSRKIVSVEGK